MTRVTAVRSPAADAASTIDTRMHRGAGEGGRAVKRRTFLKLGAIAGGAFFVGGGERFIRTSVAGAQSAVPTVDRLVMTNVVDNIYDVFARAGKIGDVTVQRTPLPAAGAPVRNQGPWIAG